MLYYTLFFISVIISLHLKQTTLISGFKINGLQLCFFIIFLFSALRFDVGYDYSMYYKLIEGKIRFLEQQLNRLEFLGRSLVIFSHKINFEQFFLYFWFPDQTYFWQWSTNDKLYFQRTTKLMDCAPYSHQCISSLCKFYWIWRVWWQCSLRTTIQLGRCLLNSSLLSTQLQVTQLVTC